MARRPCSSCCCVWGEAGCLPVPRRRASERRADVEANGGVGGRITLRFHQRRADEGIPGQALPSTAQADRGAGQVIAELPLRGGTSDVAVVGTDVQFLAPAEWHA